jgi:hypothetical protein
LDIKKRTNYEGLIWGDENIDLGMGSSQKNLASLTEVRQNISLTHQNIVMSSKVFHSSQLILYYN